MADVADSSNSTLVQLRERIRRRRWVWLVIVLVVYYVSDATEHLLFGELPLVLVTALDWLILSILVTWFMLSMTRWLDRLLTRSINRDEVHKAQEQAVQQLETTQAVARSVAHTLNQPIAIIVAYTQLLLDTPPAERNDDDLREILAASERAAILIRQFQAVQQYQTVPYANGAPMLALPETDEHQNGLYS